MAKRSAYLLSQGQRERSQDRAGIFPHKDGVVLVVADGAGGTARGEEAAQLVLEAVRALVSQSETLPDAAGWSDLLQALDPALARLGGQTTAVVASVSSTGIQGASVGDSIAWLLEGNHYQDLTQRTPIKPLLGSGEASLGVFLHQEAGGILLLASDGLWRYAPAQKICDVIHTQRGDLASAGQQLFQTVRLPSGALQDDVSIALCVCEP